MGTQIITATLGLIAVTLAGCAHRADLNTAYDRCKNKGDAEAQSSCIDEQMAVLAEARERDIVRKIEEEKRLEEARARAEAAGAKDRALYKAPDDYKPENE
jgi:hypothetical protein